MKIKLQIVKKELTIAKLNELKDLEQVAGKATFFSCTKTGDEISLVVDSTNLPDHKFANAGWKAIKIIGPLDFSLVGVLQQVIEPLSRNGISIFTISTFETDYILVKQQHLDAARRILAENFEIEEE